MKYIDVKLNRILGMTGNNGSIGTKGYLVRTFKRILSSIK